ncbi:DEAD-box ATP-dependent RNA helicase 42 isoform X2 [Capsella rubella]|uniref:DEAD-box ATP-dependent RNA helicase 42 isoform X2 n=1 Tax=Capsella rubella TaxID=81985 RepID=UPI000CD4BE32|nr:DEAD-box ATP-dependent RNA helicase 42 isoform X2 [Capsella rubella]
MTGVNTVSGDEDRSDKKIPAEIDENKVKAPNMFERAKEEFDAVIGAIHQRKGSREESDKTEFRSEKPDGKKKPNMIKKAREELRSLFQKEKPHHHHHHHHKETHGTSDDINENTPVDEVKAPNVFERAKEEIEAVIETIHPKKNEAEGSDSPKSCDSHKTSRSVSPEKERAGFGCSIGKGLEKICSPWADDKKD